MFTVILSNLIENNDLLACLRGHVLLSAQMCCISIAEKG